MKTFAYLFTFAAMALMAPLLSFAQNDYCGFNEAQQVARTETGGSYMPSFGTIKALMVFIDFSDETYDPTNPTWPVGGVGPNYLNQIIDPTETPTGQYSNITTYFNDMSFDNLHVIGTAVYKQARYSYAQYLANPQWSGNIPYWATRHAIEDLDNLGLDFSDYDRWTRYGDYSFEEKADGVVDMIFACYRYKPAPWTNGFLSEGWAHLGDGDDYSVDNGERTVQTSYPFWDNNGSGVTVVQMIQYPRLEHVEHEFGHYLGLPHNYSGGLWSLMGHRHPNVSSFMNSYEREQMGWIAFHDVGVDGLTVDLEDFGTERVAYRLLVPGSGGYESYLIENHQLLSPYDLVDISTGGAPGIYILHNYGGNVDVVAADGKWNWSNPYWVHNPWSINPLDSLPVYQRGTINRSSGYTDKVLIAHTKNGSDFINVWLEEGTGILKTTGGRYKGDGKDRFTFDENNVFSPWSAYTAYSNWNGSLTSLGVHVIQNVGQKIRVKFYTTNPVNAPPSKPVDPRLSSNSGQYGNIRFTWATNQEPDLASYEVSRKVDLYGNIWEVVAASVTNNYWVDPEYLYAPGGGDFRPTYRVRSKDTQGLYSVYSDEVSERAEQCKISVASNHKPSTYSLSQNYPNPFNPTTTFNYQIPNDGKVSLKVFNMLGQEVETLVSEVLAAGSYSVSFDASKLSSGMYIYTLKAGSFMASKKLLLVK